MSSESDLSEIYGGGYLPYSGDTADPRDLFYMSRSLRVAMPLLSLKKNRRYDHRRWETFALRRELLPKEEFMNRLGDQVTELAYRWMEPRFGEPSLARSRFPYILEKPFLPDVLTWWDGSELSAFALLVHGAWGAHYWYVFYKNERPGRRTRARLSGRFPVLGTGKLVTIRLSRDNLWQQKPLQVARTGRY